MLFVKTDELNQVVLSHTEPMDPEYGLGKTEEELRSEGYLFEYLDELPRPGKREGYRGITYCDGSKFWFEYKEADAVDLQAMVLKLEEVRTKDVARKKEVEEVKRKAIDLETAQGTVITEQGLLKDKVDVTSEALSLVNTEIESVKSNATGIMQKAELAEQTALKVEQDGVQRHENVMNNLTSQAQKLDNVDMTVSGSVMEVMMTQMQVMEQEQKIVNQGLVLDEQGNVVGMTEQMMSQVLLENMMLQMDLMDSQQKVLSLESEMVTTKKGLADTQKLLEETQAEVAALILMVLEGGGTGA